MSKIYQLPPKTAHGPRLAASHGEAVAQRETRAQGETVSSAAPPPPSLSHIDQLLDVLLSNDDRQRTQRNALLAFTVRCMSAALLYATQIVMARWMGSFEYGIYVYVWTWVLILGGLSHLGLSLASIRLAPELRERGDFDTLRGLFRGVRFAAVGFGTVIMALGIAGLTAFPDLVDSHFAIPLYLGLFCIPLYALTDVQDGLGRGSTWMGAALIPPYILRPLLLLGAMGLANFNGFAMDAQTAVGAAIIATWATGVTQALLINNNVKAVIPPGKRHYDFRNWLRLSLPLVLILGCELLLQNTDILVVSKYMTPTDVAVYFAAGKTMSLIMFVHYAVGSAVANRFAALNARGDTEGLRAFVRDAVNWTFWPSLACAIVLLFLGKPLLWLFGPQFEQGYPVMCILVVGFLVRSSMGPAEHLLNMLGEQALCATVLCAGALLNIALSIALVPTYGLIGAASATSASLAMIAIMNSIVVWRRLSIEIAIWKNLPRF